MSGTDTELAAAQQPRVPSSSVDSRQVRSPGVAVARLVVLRLLQGLAIVLAVSVVVFAVTQALPSDPARIVLGDTATLEQLREMRMRLGLDRPLYTQYFDWLGGFITGDLGRSVAGENAVSSLISSRIVNTLVLVLVTALIAIPLSIVLGAASAFRRDSLFDRGFLGLCLILAAVPEFLIALGLVILFSTTVVEWAPAVSLALPGSSVATRASELVIPVAALALGVIPYLGRLVRSSMIDTLESDYIDMARLKGVRRFVIVRRHALPNALVPAINASALTITWMIGGVVLVEYVVRYPGIGTLLVEAVGSRDLPIVQAVIVIVAVIYVLLNLAADLLTIMLTPRLRTTLT